MSEHKIPRTLTDRNPETFTVQDPALSKSFAVRELTDEQLTAYIKNAGLSHQQVIQKSMQLLREGSDIASMIAVLKYEQDRRQRTIQVVGASTLLLNN